MAVRPLGPVIGDSDHLGITTALEQQGRYQLSNASSIILSHILTSLKKIISRKTILISGFVA